MSKPLGAEHGLLGWLSESNPTARYIPDAASFVGNGNDERRLVEEPAVIDLLVGCVVVPDVLLLHELEESNETAIAKTYQRCDKLRAAVVPGIGTTMAGLRKMSLGREHS